MMHELTLAAVTLACMIVSLELAAVCMGLRIKNKRVRQGTSAFNLCAGLALLLALAAALLGERGIVVLCLLGVSGVFHAIDWIFGGPTRSA